MKKQMRILTPLLLGLIVAISVISIRRISDIRDYSKLINYVGDCKGSLPAGGEAGNERPSG